MPHRWNEAANIRRQQIESATDLTFCSVFVPYYSKLVSKLSPLSLLEVGCGTGHLSLHLSKTMGSIVAVEPSKGMYKVAIDVLRDSGVIIHNIPIQELPIVNPFDLIISHMVIQTVPLLEDFFMSISCQMNERSIFSFSIPHPCFYNKYKQFIPNEEYQYLKQYHKDVSFFISKDIKQKISGVPYYHRPLSYYFSALKAKGLQVIDFEEICPTSDIQALYGTPWEYPRYCVFQIVKAPKY